MNIISHRGNLAGPNSCIENKPSSLWKAIELGFFVEIDIWLINDKLMLGHDNPTYEIDYELLFEPKCIFHAKHLEVVPKLRELNLHWFWHENDKFTLTSHGIPWCFPGIFLQNSIILDLEPHLINTVNKQYWGICTDRALFWHNSL